MTFITNPHSDTLEPLYKIDENLYKGSFLRDNYKWTDAQLERLEKYHTLKDGNNYSEKELRANHQWTDEHFIKLYNKDKVDRGYEPIKLKSENGKPKDSVSFGKITDDFHTVNVDGADINIKRNKDGSVQAKHPKAHQWKDVNDWKKTNPDFWGNVEEEFDKQHPSVEETEKKQKFAEYEDARKELVNKIKEEHKKWTDQPADPYDLAPPELERARGALEEFDKKYKNTVSLKDHSKKVQDDYAGFLPEGEKPDLINTSKIALEHNKTVLADKYLNETQNKEFVFKTKINDLQEQIDKEEATEVSAEQLQSKKAKIASLKEKQRKAYKESIDHLSVSAAKRKERIAELEKQYQSTDDPEKKEYINTEIELQRKLSEVFFKTKGDPDKYQKEATNVLLEEYGEDIISLADVIPLNATPEEALNIYFQSLSNEADYLETKVDDDGIARRVFNIATSIMGLSEEEYTRLLGDGGVQQQLKSIAPIVMLNKLPDRLGENEERALTGNWLEKAAKNTAIFLNVTKKEAAQIFMPLSAATDAFETNTDYADNITNIVDKLNIDNAVNLAAKEIVTDRQTYDRWTAGWIGQRTGPTMAILLPMAAGSLGYGIATRFSLPLRQLAKIARTGRILKGVKAAEKTTKLGRFGQKLAVGFKKGMARNIQLGLQYEAGGMIFAGNETVADEADFLSGFLGGAGEGGVMIIPKMLSKVFGKRLDKFMNAAAKFSKAVSKPVGGGFGESAEEFAQTTWQIYRDTETHDQFKEQWLKQFGDTTERFDFFAHTFMMGMAFRGAAGFGTMMSKESSDAYWKLSGKEKAQANEFAKQYIADQNDQQRKEFVGYTAEFSDENLSVLYEDSKDWLEETKKSGSKEDVLAEQAVREYESELKRRRITQEHATVKKQIEGIRQSKEVLENNKKIYDDKPTKKLKKRSEQISSLIKAAEKKLTFLDGKLDRLRGKKAQSIIDVIPNEIKNVQSKIDNLSREESAAHNKAKKKYNAALKTGNKKVINQAGKELKNVETEKKSVDKEKESLLSEIDKLSVRKKIEQNIVDNFKRKETAVKQKQKFEKELTSLSARKQQIEVDIEKQEEAQTSEEEVEKLKKELKDVETQITGVQNRQKSEQYDKETGRPLFINISNNKQKDKKAVEEAGYEFLNEKAFASANETTGGKTSSEVIEGLETAKIGDVFDIKYTKRSEMTEDQKKYQSRSGENYEHFINIVNNEGIQVGGVSYKSTVDRAIKRAIQLGFTPKIVVTKKNKHSISYEVIIPEGQKASKPTSKTKQNMNRFDDSVSAKMNNEGDIEFNRYQSDQASEIFDVGFTPKGSLSVPVSKNNTNMEIDSMQQAAIDEMNRIMMDMINDMAKNIPFVRQMLKTYYFGNLINKGSKGAQYAGFHVLSPYNAVFINIAGIEGVTSEGMAWDLLNTIAHELNHYKYQGHDNDFINGLATLQRNMKELGIHDKYFDQFKEFADKYKNQIKSLRNEYKNPTTKSTVSGIGTETIPASAARSDQGTSESIQSGRVRSGNYDRMAGPFDTATTNPGLRPATEGLDNTGEVEFLERNKETKLKDQIEFIRNHWDEMVTLIGREVRSEFTEDSDFFGSENDIISHIKQLYYSNSEYGEAIKRTKIIDLERANILKAAGLIQKKGGITEIFDYESNEMAGQTGQQKFLTLRSAFKFLFERMKIEGIDNSERVIYDLSQRGDFKNAFKNKRTLNLFLEKFSKEDPVLSGILSDETIINFENLLSLKNFYSNTKLFKNVVIERQSNTIIEYNKNQEHRVIEFSNRIKKTVKSFVYGKHQSNSNDAINAIYADYYQGPNSKEAKINRDNSGRQKGILLHELHKEFLSKITNIPENVWEGYLTNEKIEGKYHRDILNGIKVKPKIIHYMTSGKYAPIGSYNSASKMVAYLINKQSPSPQSVVVKLVNVANDESSISLYFDNVSRNKELSLEQNSHLAITLNGIVKIAKQAYYKTNHVAQYYAKKGVPAIVHKLNGMFGNNGTVEADKLTDNDLGLALLNAYHSGKETYNQWIGQFGGKDQLYFIQVPKFKNARKAYQELYDRTDIEDRKMMLDPADKEIIQKEIDVFSQIMIPMSGYFSVFGEERNAFIENFIFNFALNKFAIDQIVHGKPSQYKDAIEMVKRGGSTNSPGMAADTNMEGGVGEEQNHVISTDFEIEGREAFDGVQFATQDYMDKFSISIGSVFSKVKKLGLMNSIKAIYSTVTGEGIRALTKTNIVVIDNLAFAFPDSVYGKVYNYMKQNNIDTMSFLSGTKKPEGAVTKLFEKLNFKKNIKPEIIKRLNKNFLAQHDLRYSIKPQVKKQPIQSTANFMQFKNANEVAALWNIIQEMMVEEVSLELEKNGEFGADLILLDNINQETRKNMYDYIKKGGKETNPYFDRTIQNIRSAYITRKILKKGVNRAAYQEIPVADVGLRTIRHTKDGKHVLLPEVNLNVDGKHRFSETVKNKKTAIDKIHSNADYYIDLLDSKGNVNEWELIILDNGEVEIPGEVVQITRVPADAPHSHAFARLKNEIPGAGNVIMTDWKTQHIGGADNDGDIRFVEFFFKDKNGNMVVSEEETEEEKLMGVVFGDKKQVNRKALINQAMILMVNEYQKPGNYNNITEPINTDAYNEKILPKVKKDIDYKQNNPSDALGLRRLNVSSAKIIGIAADYSTAYAFIKKHALSIKEATFDTLEKAEKLFDKKEIFKVGGKYIGTKKFTIPKYNLDTGEKIGTIKMNGFSQDKYGLINNHMSNLLNIALDNDKDPKAEFLGLTEQTATMFLLMVSTDADIDKLSKEEQEEAIMQRITDTVAYFNSPLLREYIKLQRAKSNTSIDQSYTDKEIFEKLKNTKGVKHADIMALKQMHNMSKDVDKIFKYINRTRELPADYIKTLTSQYNQDIVERNKLNFIDTSGFFDYKNTGKISPFLSSIKKVSQLANKYVHKKTIIKGSGFSQIVNRFGQLKENFLNENEIELIAKKAYAAITVMAFNPQNRSDISVSTRLKEYINENPENEFIKFIVFRDNKIKVHENLESTKINNVQLDKTKEGFDKLPEDIQDMFLVYSISNYGVNLSNSNGNFANMFSNNLQLRIGNVLAGYTDQWQDEFSDEKIERLSENIRMSTYSLDYSSSGKDKIYSHKKGDLYIDVTTWKQVGSTFIRKFNENNGDTTKTLKELFELYNKHGETKKINVLNRLISENNAYKSDNSLAKYIERVIKEQSPPQLKRSDALVYPNNFDLYTLHSGGANGSDTYWHTIGKKHGLKNGRHYNAFEKLTNKALTAIGAVGEYITGTKSREGYIRYLRANRKLSRPVAKQGTPFAKLVSRNWFQVKNSDALFAIGNIVNPGDDVIHKGNKYIVKSIYQSVDGGTGYAVQMAIDENKPVHVFDQNKNSWFSWDYNTNSFTKEETPVLTSHFAGIGTREINENGKKAIEAVYKKTTEQIKSKNYAIDTPGADIYVMKTELQPGGFSVLVKEGKIIETIPAGKMLLGKTVAEAQAISERKGGSFTKTGEKEQTAKANDTKLANRNDAVKFARIKDNQIDTDQDQIYIGRTTKAEFHFGNPFNSKGSNLAKGNETIGRTPTNDESVELFENWLDGKFPNLESERRTWILDQIMRGKLENKELVCFAHGGKCHGDILKNYDFNPWRENNESSENDQIDHMMPEDINEIKQRLSLKPLNSIYWQDFYGNDQTKSGFLKIIDKWKQQLPKGYKVITIEHIGPPVDSVGAYFINISEANKILKKYGLNNKYTIEQFIKLSEEKTLFDDEKSAIDDLYNEIIYNEKIDRLTSDQNELLANDSPELQNFIVKHFQKIFPGLKIFNSPQDFAEFIDKMGGDMSNFQLNSIGAAFMNGVYIDSQSATQSTFIHENAHIYWNLLPDNHPIKEQLIEMFGTTEDAIIEIGKAGVRYAEAQMEYEDATKWRKFQILVKRFWEAVSKMFSGASKQDPVFTMVENIWKNKDGIFDQATQNATLDHMISHDKVSFNEENHVFTSIDGSIEFTSATQLVKSLQVKRFNATEQAIKTISKESVKKIKKGEGAYSIEEETEKVQQLKDKWEGDNRRGTDLHNFIELWRTGQPIPASIEDHFASNEVLNDFSLKIENYFRDMQIDPGTEIYEEVLADFDSYIAGMKDLSFRQNGKLHITDFKFSRKSKYNDDGETLADSYTQPFGGRRFKKPLSKALDNEQTHHTIQLNIYGEIVRRTTGEVPFRLSITPINYETDDNGRITKINFEKQIPVKTVTNDTQRLFDINKRRVEVAIENTSTSNEKRGYIDKTALKVENDAIIRLTSLLHEGQSLSDLKDDPLLADEIYQQSGLNISSILVYSLGFSESELSEIDLFTLLTHWQDGEKKSGEDVIKKAFPSTTGFEAAYKGNATSDTKDKFQKDRQVALKIYTDIGTLANLESMPNEQLFNHYTKLRTMDSYTAGPLLYYIEQTLVREMLVKEVGKENSPGFNGYKRATVLLNEISQSEQIKKEDKISWFSQLFLNDRTIGHNHRRIQYFVSKVREARNKADSTGMDIQFDINHFFKKGLDIEKLTLKKGKNDTLYFKKNPETDWTQNEIDFVNYIYNTYAKYHHYHRHQSSLPDGVIPLIPIPEQMRSGWGMSWDLGKFGLRGSQYNKYFKSSPYDQEIVNWNGEEMTLENAKRKFSLGDDKLNDFIKVWKEAEKSFERSPESVKQKRTSIAIKNSQLRNYNKFAVSYEKKMFKHVLSTNLISVAEKYYMEPIVPLWKLTESAYAVRGENFKNLTQFIDKFGQMQIFGNVSSKKAGWDYVFEFMMKMTAMKSLYLNWFAQILNLSIGVAQNYVRGTKPDATGWKAFVPTAFFNGLLRISTNPIKVRNMLKRYGVVDVTNEHALDDLQRVKKKANAISMGFTWIVEGINHGLIFSGMMSQEQWTAHGQNGKLKKGKENTFTEQDRKVIENEVRAAHGDYGTKNKRFINYSSIGRAVMEFRNWMPAFIEARFGSAYIDENGVKKMGFYRFLSQYIFIKYYYNNLPKSYKEKRFNKYKEGGTNAAFNKMTDEELIGTIALLIRDAEAGKLKFKEMSVSDQRAVGMAMRSLSTIAAILTYMASGDEEKKKKSLLDLFFMRFTGDILMYGNIQYLTDSFVPALKWLNNMIVLGVLSSMLLSLKIGEKFDIDLMKKYGDGALYKSNTDYGKKGEPKAINAIIRVIPYGSGIYSTKRLIYEKEKPPKRGKNSLSPQSLKSGSLKPKKLEQKK